MAEKPTSLLRFYEAWAHLDGATRTRNGVVFYDEFDDWRTLKGNFAVKLDDGVLLDPKQMTLRLITCEHAGPPHTLGLTQAFFERLRDDFNLHETTEEAFVNNNGAFTRYFSMDTMSAVVESLSLVIRIPFWVKGCEALSLSHDPRTGSTRAFIHWIADKAHAELVDFLHRQEVKSSYKHPLLLPSWLLRRHRKITEAYRGEIDQSILKIEHHIGYALPGRLYYKPARPLSQSLVIEGYSFEDIIRRLHASFTELGARTMEANFGRDLGVFLKKTGQKLRDSNDVGSQKVLSKQSESLLHQINFNTSLYSTMSAQIAVLKDRVQSHINLTFSLIAQEENKLSREVAMNSKRDSAAMKTIAVVTMFFLPPTFVASLFSMSMFDWGAEGPETGPMSAYFWVYWAVAIPLTLLVMLVWRVWWKREERQYINKMRSTK